MSAQGEVRICEVCGQEIVGIACWRQDCYFDGYRKQKAEAERLQSALREAREERDAARGELDAYAAARKPGQMATWVDDFLDMRIRAHAAEARAAKLEAALRPFLGESMTLLDFVVAVRLARAAIAGLGRDAEERGNLPAALRAGDVAPVAPATGHPDPETHLDDLRDLMREARAVLSEYWGTPGALLQQIDAALAAEQGNAPKGAEVKDEG